jgi:hypothetical protein
VHPPSVSPGMQRTASSSNGVHESAHQLRTSKDKVAETLTVSVPKHQQAKKTAGKPKLEKSESLRILVVEVSWTSLDGSFQAPPLT